MYLLNKELNILTKINETTFSEHKLNERNNLQEWIDNDPTILSKVLGEDDDLLIIQKEFCGFDKTKERLDLLAIDKNGNLVIIENKLDDSGKDVTWQALKYASYCSALTKGDIISIYQKYLDQKYPYKNYDAKKKLDEYLNDGENTNVNIRYTQKIILVAKEFRPEVTSAVLWLKGSGINIQCIKVVPYLFDNKLIIDIDKIIPLPEAEEFLVGVLRKDTEEKNALIASGDVYSQYWAKLLAYGRDNKLDLFRNRNGSRSSTISAGSGIAGVSYTLSLLKDKIRIDLYINKSTSEENRIIFNLLYEDKDLIERKFDNKQLNWECSDEGKTARISYSRDFQRENLGKSDDEYIKWHVEYIKKLEYALKESLSKIKNKF